MRFIIKHEIEGRMRIHILQKSMSPAQADTLLYAFRGKPNVHGVKVYERTGDVVIRFGGNREILLQDMRGFSWEKADVPEDFLENSGRELNAVYQEKLVTHVLVHYGKIFFLPAPVRAVLAIWKAGRYIREGIRCLGKKKLEVPVLDALAISVNLIRGDFGSAGSVMFMLGLGELLEEWTHKKSVGDLARALSLQVGRVWVETAQGEVLMGADQIVPGDIVIIHLGHMLPFDGEVIQGEGMVNQSSLTGESVPVRKAPGNIVFAGTYLEEGELRIRVKEAGGTSRYEKIVAMIEESQKLKSNAEGKAAHLADRLVPWTLGGTELTWLLTRNIQKTLSVLMVDFSCALKLAMPIAVLSAIREGSLHHITIKGGKYLEEVSRADTVVFDKTGTLTKAHPTVACVVPFSMEDPQEILRIAACLEEHFPHSMAKAVVDAAKEQSLFHEEMHSQVEYIVAHGIATHIGQQRVIIGSYHFVFEDENCQVPEGMEEAFADLPVEYSHLYLAVDQVLAGVICLEDPLREEAAAMMASLRRVGFKKLVMMTGDSERTAKAVAAKVGVDEYFAEVLPDDKARYIQMEREKGGCVMMIGDGINDSPALSAADVGIAISDGAAIAREIADITIEADSLFELLTLKILANALMKRIDRNYKTIMGFNGMLLFLGVGGIIRPTTSALLHNASTLAISLHSMGNLLEEN